MALRAYTFVCGEGQRFWRALPNFSSRFSPRFARAETAVLSKPESLISNFEFLILNFEF
jgi:hypothetical protein